MNNIKRALLGKFGKQLLLAQKHSPKVLFVAGVAGMVGTVVLASRATMKMPQVLEDHEKQLVDIAETHERHVATYSEQDANKDAAIVMAKTILKVARLYAPAVVTGVVTVAALTGSHMILTNRLHGVTAAYALLDKGFRQYRSRVVSELGVEKDAEFRYGVETQEIVEETPDGPVVTTLKKAAHGKSIYAVDFDEGSTQWKRDDMMNQMFLRSQQDWANDMLRAYGYLFLNDVYKMLGLPKTPAGQLVGWIMNNPEGGDNYIDFGIFSTNDFFVTERFINGDTRSIKLDFNVDGIVWDKIAGKDA